MESPTKLQPHGSVDMLSERRKQYAMMQSAVAHDEQENQTKVAKARPYG